MRTARDITLFDYDAEERMRLDLSNVDNPDLYVLDEGRAIAATLEADDGLTELVVGTVDGEHVDACRIHGGMQWGRSPGSKKRDDKSVLHVNARCELVGIPAECHACTVSGRSPLEWAVAVLRAKTDRDSGIANNPNGWADWRDEPSKLIRHLRRLAYLGQRSANIIAGRHMCVQRKRRAM